jgi:hypothetical protein
MQKNSVVIGMACLHIYGSVHSTANQKEKKMRRTILISLIALVFGTMAIAETATQTDWSGGAGISGPVLNWGNTFDMENNLNWYSVGGELSLDYSTPIEHSVWSSYVNVNYAFPVDIDGDGDVDVLGAAGRYSPPYFFSGRIDWWENTDGSGTTWTYHTVDNSFTSSPSISSADLDGDGDMDVIGAARGSINDISWWENIDGSGTNWVEHTVPSSIQEASSVDTADVDGDGDVDLLSTDASYNDVMWLENADGSGTSWIDHVIDGSFNTPYDVYGADVDGDGDKDAVGAAFNSDQISWWENVDGSGITWNEHPVSGNFNGARSVFAADVDGDGDTDILGAASLDWAVTWWENYDGLGNSWVEHFISGSFNYAFAVHASDVDQDGDTDVLGASYFGDDIAVWENTDGLGLTWYEHVIDGNFDGARDVSTADMDGDGDPDILGVAREASDISWWDVTCCVGAGELVSSILDTEVSADWDSIVWTSDEPSGTSIYFQVRSSMDPQYMGDWSSNIATPGTLENYLNDGDRYVQYRVMLETTDPGLSPILWDVTISWTELGIDEERNFTTQSVIQLLPNHPNPFHQITTIEFNLPKTSDVILNIFNILGEEVATLHSGQLLPGRHSFEWDAFNLPSGVYVYRLEVEDYVQTRKMILLR